VSTANRVHRVKGKTVIRHYRIIPYAELVEILREDGEAFFEDSPEEPLKRQTIWKASRKLSAMVGKKVVANRALLRVQGRELEGYSFSLSHE